MSNHSGGHILNELLNQMHSLGFFTDINDDLRTAFIDKLLKICGSYDCNWGDIIDRDLAKLFKVCRSCEKMISGTEITKIGYCDACYNEIDPEDIEWLDLVS